MAHMFGSVGVHAKDTCALFTRYVPRAFSILSLQQEIRSMIKKRRDFEYLLAKRVPAESDYVRYLEYELNIEALRRMRKERMGLKKTSMSDHAGTRRIHFIFQRACRRFRGHESWWLQWLDFSLRTDSAKAAGKILAKALQLHPHSEELWLQAAEFEFDRQHNMAAARAIMQRSLRANKQSRRLWIAYFRMECLYVLKMKGRRMLLGLGVGQARPAPSGDHAVLPPSVAESAGAESALTDAASDAATEEFDPNLADDKMDKDVAPADENADLFAGLNMGGPASASGGQLAAGGAAVDPLESMGTDARTAFFSGAVPRIIFDTAAGSFPSDLGLHLQFLDAADRFADIPTSAPDSSSAAGASSAAGPAFPTLSSHMLSTVASSFPTDPRMWQALASRPVKGIVGEVKARDSKRRAQAIAMAGASAAGAASSSSAGAIADAVPAAAADDGALFVIDTHGKDDDNGNKQQQDEASDNADEMEEDDAAADEDASGAGDDDGLTLGQPPSLAAYAGSSNPHASGASRSSSSSAGGAQQVDLQCWAKALSSGAIDSYVIRGLEKMLLKEADAGNLGAAASKDASTSSGNSFRHIISLLPSHTQSLWSIGQQQQQSASVAAASSSSASSSSTASGKKGKKRQREGDDASTAAASDQPSSSPFTLVVENAIPVLALPEDEEHLVTAAGQGASQALAVFQAALQAASSDGDSAASSSAATSASAAHPSMYAAAVGVLVQLASLPFLRSAANCSRVVAVYQSIAKLAGEASAAMAMTLSQTEKHCGVMLELVKLQALLRLGHVDEAVASASAAVARAPDQPVLAIAHARLSHAVGCAAKELGSAAAAASAPPAASGDVIPAATVKLSQLQPQTATLEAPDAILQRSISSKAILPAGQLHLWLGLVEAKAATKPTLNDAAAALKAASLAGLPPGHDDVVRQRYLDICMDHPRANHWDLQPVLTPTASAAAHLQVLNVVAGAVLARAAAAVRDRAAAPGSGAAVVNEASAALTSVRNMFKASLSHHGKRSVDLWLGLIQFERAAGRVAAQLGSSAKGQDLVSVATSNALRTLEPAFRAAFTEAQTLAAVAGSR